MVLAENRLHVSRANLLKIKLRYFDKNVSFNLLQYCLAHMSTFHWILLGIVFLCYKEIKNTFRAKNHQMDQSYV